METAVVIRPLAHYGNSNLPICAHIWKDLFFDSKPFPEYWPLPFIWALSRQNGIFMFFYSLTDLLWQLIFFVIFLFFLGSLYFLLFFFPFFWAPNYFFLSFRPFYPIKNIQLKQLERMANTPLYGSHITIVWWGPQGPRTSCSQDNLWPFWIDPWDPQPTHVYITD